MSEGGCGARPLGGISAFVDRLGNRRGRRLQRLASAFIVVTSGAVAVCTSVASLAQPPSDKFRILWTRGPDTSACFDRDALMKSVAERLGADPFDDAGSRIVIGSVAHVRGRYVVNLQLVDGAESFPARQLQSSIDDCAALMQAAALSMALDIEASDRARSERSGAGTEEAGAPSDAEIARMPSLGAEDASTDAGRPARIGAGHHDANEHAHRGAAVSLGGLASAGLLPRVAAGIDVSGLVRFDHRWSALLGMSYFPEVHADDPNFMLSSGFVHGGVCYALSSWRSGEVGACGQALVGSTTLIIDTLQPVKPGARYFVAPSLGVRFSQAFGHALVLSIGADVLTPFPRYQYDVLGTNRTIFTAPVVAGVVSGQIGVGFR